jgi:hypothetical protein
MKNIVELIFDSFRTIYSPEKPDNQPAEQPIDQQIDYKQDYSVMWDTFKAHRGVDLNKDNISWVEFSNMLHGVLLEGVGSLCKVIEHRTYKKPPEGKNAGKQIENEQHMQKMKMKYLYRIRKTEQQERAGLSNTLHSIMNYLRK